MIPNLVVRDGAAALDFYAKAFGAEEILRLHEPDGRVAHAELSLFGGVISVASEYPSLSFLGPTSDRISYTLTVYVEDVDAVAARAVAAGARLERPIEVEFYGGRCGPPHRPVRPPLEPPEPASRTSRRRRCSGGWTPCAPSPPERRRAGAREHR